MTLARSVPIGTAANLAAITRAVALANGRRTECLTIVDDFTRECLDIAVDYGISGGYGAPVLKALG